MQNQPTIKSKRIMKTKRQSVRGNRLAPLSAGAEVFHDLIWDLGICSIESIEPYNLFTSPCSTNIPTTFSTHVNYVEQYIGQYKLKAIQLIVKYQNTV